MICEPFSVVIVPFPFTDKHQNKRRPAIVLSKTAYQKETKHVTLLMVTSAKNSQWFNDYILKDTEYAGLLPNSVARQKIFTIDEELIIGHRGKLSARDIKSIRTVLKKHLSLS